MSDFFDSRELFGLQTRTLGFALWLDFGISVPIVGGVVNTTTADGAFTGLVTVDKCVSYERTRTFQTPPSAVVMTIVDDERNTSR